MYAFSNRFQNTCGAQHPWMSMARWPNTLCQNLIYLLTSWTAQGCVMKQRRSDSVYSKVLETWLWRWVYINTPRGGARDTGAASSSIDLIRKATISLQYDRLPHFRAEGEYNYEPRWLSAAGRAGGWSPQAIGGGLQPGLPVNEGTPFTLEFHSTFGR